MFFHLTAAVCRDLQGDGFSKLALTHALSGRWVSIPVGHLKVGSNERAV